MQVSRFMRKPVINAGDGTGEHPTQVRCMPCAHTHTHTCVRCMPRVLGQQCCDSADEKERGCAVFGDNVHNGGSETWQALLDVYTIREEIGTVNGLTIAMVGDLKHGRTVHSLVQLLSLYDVKIRLVSPKGLEMPAEYVQMASSKGIDVAEHGHINDVIGEADVVYVTRTQKVC